MSDEARIHEIRQKVAEYAKATAEREYLDEFKKSQLAILMKKYEGLGISAVSGQEREARADPEYKTTLEGLKAAVENAERLRWELKILEMQFDAWRTRQANQRAERGKYDAGR